LREKVREKPDTDSNLIGYERLLLLFKTIQKQTHKGVGMKRESKSFGTYILLQFKVGEKRDEYRSRNYWMMGNFIGI